MTADDDNDTVHPTLTPHTSHRAEHRATPAHRGTRRHSGGAHETAAH